MRRMIMVLVLILIILGGGSVYASDFFPLEDIRGNGGYEIGVVFLNLADLNEMLEVNGYLPLNQLVLLNGGGGMGGKRLGSRLGGYGCGGEVSSQATNGDKAELGIGFGGFVYEKGFYVKDNTDIAVGTMFGGGGATLKLTRSNSSETEKYSKGFIAFEPRLSLHQQIYGNWGIELRAGYLVTYDFHTDWEIGDTTITGPFRFQGGPRVGVRLTYGF